MTVRFFYVTTFLLLSVTGELLLQSFGLSFPFTAFFIFYICTAFGWKTAAAGALFAACGLDLAVGHFHPYSLTGLTLTVFLSRFWLYHVESDSIALHFIPGAVIPLFMTAGSLIFSWSSIYELPQRLSLLLGSSACGMIWLPFLIMLLDSLNEVMGMELYANAKLNLSKE